MAMYIRTESGRTILYISTLNAIIGIALYLILSSRYDTSNTIPITECQKVVPVYQSFNVNLRDFKYSLGRSFLACCLSDGSGWKRVVEVQDGGMLTKESVVFWVCFLAAEMFWVWRMRREFLNIRKKEIEAAGMDLVKVMGFVNVCGFRQSVSIQDASK
ncbi:hypothetical protein BJ508DRAFT_330392 [Ascobolus immersus RN42]|uniref:Uncharacterized protein n=1 Tax=Ascobolus immersus RN42 TaxID=1160509 RepID=A0A3N4HTN7_ASCIM|nr:hypothetical protein BJ508DRAFT_330392 [Ascobolus immersus RN42]